MIRKLVAFALAALLSACGRNEAWHATDITGAMPRLEFAMSRASDGEAVTARNYHGHIVLLYFGYTHCPDVCPATLADLTDVLRRLGARAKDVSVLFVTVDPNRDTLPILKAYANAFAPEIDGLRGTPDALAALARRYRVAYSVATNPYTVMHSSAVFFFDRNGRARLVTMNTDDIAGLTADLNRLLD
ncbi:MAG TPA: SCO family protein [Rhizomicrobium sp.]|jgi:protein SCO1/2|nr:SCO family protein [Rhizomicrobium sp.]